MNATTEYQLPPQSDDALTVTADAGKDFALCPAGQHPARCVDVVYRGEFPNKFKPGVTQKKLSLHFMIDAQDDDGHDVRRTDGKRFVLSAWFTKSMHEKANLRKTLESWRGRAFDDEAAETFNLNDLVGAAALVNVKHVRNAKGDEVAVIDTVSRLPRQMTVFPVHESDWVRLKDRPREPQTNGHAAGPGRNDDVPPPEDDGYGYDDSLPF